MGAAELVLAVLSGGVGFVAADAIDRLLATYNPGGSTPPADKFTSTGSGTLANTLNIAARPNWKRLAAGAGVTAVPAIGSMFIDSPMAKSALEGMTIGAGISFFKTLWNNLLMPMFIGQDTSTPTIQKSVIARLYPAEVSAAINVRTTPAGQQPALSSTGSGALSGSPETGVGAPADVGPFALAADSPYPDATQMLRRATGVQGPSQYPDVAAVTRAQAGVRDEPYPTTESAIRHRAGVSEWQPGPAADVGPGPKSGQPSEEQCGCGSPADLFFLGDQQEEPLIG